MRTTTRNLARLATVSVMVLMLAGCATHNRKHNNTLIGAGLGGAAGAVLTGGDPIYTLGGAAAGGVLGNILTDDKPSSRNASKRGRNHASSSRGNSRWSSDRNSRRSGHHNSRRR